MTFLRHEILLQVPPAFALDYLSTPSAWPEWHPSCVEVDCPVGSLPVGTVFRERIRSAGKERDVVWTVTEKDPERSWSATGTADGGLSIMLRYEVRNAGRNGCYFARVVEYHFQSWPMRILDWLFIQRRVAVESSESLHRLFGAVKARFAAKSAHAVENRPQ